MTYIEKHPMIMIVVGVVGISLSAIFVKFSQAPSAVTAAWRLLWTVILMTPAVLRKEVRTQMAQVNRKTVILSLLSGLFLAAHFAVWFESLRHTSVASSTTIVCTEVIWVSLGYCLFLKGKLTIRAIGGLLPSGIAISALWGLGGLLIGSFLGGKVFDKLDGSRLKSFVYIFMALSGAWIAFNG